MTESPAYVCSHVFEKTRRVLLVARDDGDWQFLCGGDHAENERPRVVGVNHLFEDDPTLEAVRDLPPNWEAERDSVGAPWRRQRSA